MRVGGTSRPTFSARGGLGRGRTTWSPPYALPNAGEVVEISTNFASDVKPTTHSASQWNNALFAYFGGGALVEDYSRAGGYVIAGSGGHAVPPNLGACIFDLEDATWKRLDNANGVPQQNTDFAASEIESTFGEILAAGSPTTSTGCPAPAHLYTQVMQLRSGEGGGGQKGSFMRMFGRSAAIDSSRGSNWAHAIDLETGLWTRRSTNSMVNGSTSRAALYDPVTNKYWSVSQLLNNGVAIDYLDGADWTWKTHAITPPGSIGNTYGAFIDVERRLIIAMSDNENFYALNADNPTAVTQLTVSGTVTNFEEQYIWQFYPPDGCFYRFAGLSTTTTIRKLKPPPLDGDPLTDTWTISDVTVDTALTQQFHSSAIHHNRFFRVPLLGCFAWIPGGDEPVVLLKPPA